MVGVWRGVVVLLLVLLDASLLLGWFWFSCLLRRCREKCFLDDEREDMLPLLEGEWVSCGRERDGVLGPSMGDGTPLALGVPCAENTPWVPILSFAEYGSARNCRRKLS